MLIGLSLSQCVKDIVNHKVDIMDVMCIIAQTQFDFENSNQWMKVFDDFSSPNLFHGQPWKGLDEPVVWSVVDELWHTGKIHQPRRYGAFFTQDVKSDHWLECFPRTKNSTPAVKQAYNDYKLLVDLANDK